MRVWTQAGAVRTRLAREWERGRILGHLWGGTPLFPCRIPLVGPTTHDLVERYGEAREWIRQVNNWESSDVVIEWRDFKHPVLGQNRVPTAVIIETPEAALRWLNKMGEAHRAEAALRIIQDGLPALNDWALTHPLEVLEWSEVWPRLLVVIRWVLDHPRSGLYLRQVDAHGVDTKFIERHRRILSALLDEVLDPSAIDREATGVSGFEARYGFREKPQMVRFRLLDSTQSIQGMNDLTIPGEEFSKLAVPCRRVFMMENEIEFLAFPSLSQSLAIFGAGYGLKRFRDARWLLSVPLYYWGDIDTHGFAILDELRMYLPHAESLLMDEATLVAHRAFWDHEDRPSTHTLTRLTDSESALYEGLQRHRFGTGVRLEQERIPLHWLVERLAQMGLTGH